MNRYVGDGTQCTRIFNPGDSYFMSLDLMDYPVVAPSDRKYHFFPGFDAYSGDIAIVNVKHLQVSSVQDLW